MLSFALVCTFILDLMSPLCQNESRVSVAEPCVRLILYIIRVEPERESWSNYCWGSLFILLSIRYITLCTEYQPTAARRAVDPRSWNLFQFPSKRSHNNLYMVQILKCLDSNDVEVQFTGPCLLLKTSLKRTKTIQKSYLSKVLLQPPPP